MSELTCFKAYDVRGRIPDQLNEDIARRIGRAFVGAILSEKAFPETAQPETAGADATRHDAARHGQVVVGRDIRLTSESLKDALVEGLLDGGVDVLDIGQCGTEEVYFAVVHTGATGGVMVTASHNPKDYNGMKFVRADAKAVSADSGLPEIKALAETLGKSGGEPGTRGRCQPLDITGAYDEHLLSYIDVSALNSLSDLGDSGEADDKSRPVFRPLEENSGDYLPKRNGEMDGSAAAAVGQPQVRQAVKPLKLVVNAGNGGAGAVIDRLEARLPFEFVKLHHEPDGHFPNGVPNPLLAENRAVTADAVRHHGADMGLAWDGDFDRCFFFDENGDYIEGYYLVGLLAEVFLRRAAGGRVVHDPRLTWNTLEVVERLGGEPVQSKAGHAFMKETMRKTDAVYGGEMSAHHFFRDFSYCDSGMIPWLLVAELLGQQGRSLSELVAERMAAYPCSGEINRQIDDPQATLALVEARYAKGALRVDRTDGLGIEYPDWRFNLRLSNTEPLVRLNVESRADVALMHRRRDELLALIG